MATLLPAVRPVLPLLPAAETCTTKLAEDVITGSGAGAAGAGAGAGAASSFGAGFFFDLERRTRR